MFKPIARAVAAAAFLGWVVPLTANPPSTAAAAQRSSVRGAAATVDAFHSALRRGDTRAAAALLADDALIFEEGGAERSKAEYAAHHLPADAQFAAAVASSVTRRSGRAAGTLAWIASEGRLSGMFKGKPVDRLTTETVILRRSARGWSIVHIHWSSAPARG